MKKHVLISAVIGLAVAFSQQPSAFGEEAGDLSPYSWGKWNSLVAPAAGPPLKVVTTNPAGNNRILPLVGAPTPDHHDQVKPEPPPPPKPVVKPEPPKPPEVEVVVPDPPPEPLPPTSPPPPPANVPPPPPPA